MRLQKFPMDTQLCPLHFGSRKYYIHTRFFRHYLHAAGSFCCCCALALHFFQCFILLLLLSSDGYGVDDVLYVWTHGAGKSIAMAPIMTLSQFDLIGFPSGNYTSEHTRGKISIHNPN